MTRVVPFLKRLFPSFGIVKCCLIVCLMMTVLPLIAEEPPSWYDLKIRNTRYPSEVYFSGFVLGEQLPGESLQQAVDRIKREAQVEAASSIRMKVEKTLTEANQSELVRSSGSFDEKVTEQFNSFTQIRVDMEIPGLKVEAWKNESKNEIAAFAYVRKDELAHKLERRLITGITKVELTLENVDRLKNEGRKLEARKMVEEGMRLFDDIEQTQALLLSIDNDGSTELQLEETLALKQSMTDRMAELRHGIAICMQVKAYCDEEPYPYLEKQLQGTLHSLGCHFTNDTAEAEWVVSVDAKTREHQHTVFGNVDLYVSYMDAQVSIFKVNTGQRVYENLVIVKGTHVLNFEEAAREAYKGGVKKISILVKQAIEQ